MNQRAFVDQSVPEIISMVLSEKGCQQGDGMDFVFKLKEEYPKREFCCQYEETTAHFVHRLCEEEGINIFYQHNEDNHCMILCDDNNYFPNLDNNFTYAPDTGFVADHPEFKRFDVNLNSSTTETTYAALKELGQQQLMPEAQRQSHHERGLLHYLNPVNWFNSSTYDSDMSQTDKDHIEQVQTTEDIEKMSEVGQGYDIEGVDGKKPFELEEIDGLKVLIGTLACDNTHTISAYEQAQYACYRSIYIHSKVLVVDDIFTLIASANINILSLWADSESGIAVPDAALGYKMRKELWEMHATESMDNPDNNSSVAIKCDAVANYEHWNNFMNDNWKYKAKRQPLAAHIVRFWDTTTGYAYAVDLSPSFILPCYSFITQFLDRSSYGLPTN
ncbi:hypothetical protein DM558_00670 [Entomomonas moraniae]|uniref:PLD phosphodiesterase domain-containing protein n=1 Tax=Entomomonas moraniae TaxID=2213226 RepID=A0A3Q9JJ98_9GAMM|nr:contractile injection system protein, VgrG/Pvc8 family [Entomomonas moraniae]AZS49382.1 hypothetical protein DM558_00670 [Entomomonas moraniae]